MLCGEQVRRELNRGTLTPSSRVQTSLPVSRDPHTGSHKATYARNNLPHVSGLDSARKKCVRVNAVSGGSDVTSRTVVLVAVVVLVALVAAVVLAVLLVYY